MERPATLRLGVAAIEERSLVGMTTETEAEVKTITAAAKTVGAAVCV
jgi:hypothetical protein